MYLNHQDLDHPQLYRYHELLKEAENDRLVKQLSKHLNQSNFRQQLGHLLVKLGQRLQGEPEASWA